MSDYVLTFTLSGETATHRFDSLRIAEIALGGLRGNPHCERAVLSGMGHEIDRYVRDACPTCAGQRSVDGGRWSAGVVVSDPGVCDACGGRGVVQGPYNPLVEPPVAGMFDCPLCRQPVPYVATTEYEPQDISEIPF